jgi:hypothetical protein
MRSFVLGNGKSRLNFNFHHLKKFGKIYGCNALYREFEPDYLIAVDTKMIFEIESKGWQKTHEVWTNPNAKYKKFVGFNYFNPSLGWSSGPTALNFAADHGPKEIYIFGFDYIGMPNGLVNNVYTDTENYKKSHESATYYGNWRRQTEQTIKNHSAIKFFRVVDKNNFFDPDFEFKNFKHLYLDDFNHLVKTW